VRSEYRCHQKVTPGRFSARKLPLSSPLKVFFLIALITLFLIKFLSESYLQSGITEQAAFRNDRTAHCAIFK